jgi:hypothetical protein
LKADNYILKGKLDIYYTFIEERKNIFDEWSGKGEKKKKKTSPNGCKIQYFMKGLWL